MNMSSMSTSQMISGLCGLGLVGVLISKQILLLNEETIVLVAFIAFVYTVYTKAGSMADEIFVSRRAAIQSELQHYVEMQEEVLTSLVREHTAHDLVSQSVQDIARTTLSEMGGMGAARRAHVEATTDGSRPPALRSGCARCNTKEKRSPPLDASQHHSRCPAERDGTRTRRGCALIWRAF